MKDLSRKTLSRWAANYKAERDASALYRGMAAAEPNADLAAVYRKLADTEAGHLEHWKEKIEGAGGRVPSGGPSLRTRLMLTIARKRGAAAIVPAIASIEAGAGAGYEGQLDAAPGMAAQERSHARIFGALAKSGQGMSGSELARFEGRHRTGGNALRAGVLGVNDGLVSVFSLVMGVAGSGAGRGAILVAGGAGLISGALSMALGEWLSVQSARELYAKQISVEKDELETAPEEEAEELALIYQAKGLGAQEARDLAGRIVSDKETALDTLAREELNIDPEELGGSAFEAALTSFFLFAAGAILPLIPYAFVAGWNGVAWSAGLSAAGLFASGAVITLMTGKNPLLSGLRQVLVGLAAAAVTYGVGALVGVGLGI